MSESANDRKIGEGHASAFFRQGLRELRAALYPDSNVAQPPELGLYGTLTPGEIAEARRSPAPELEEEKGDSPLQQSLRLAESRAPERKSRDKDLER